MGGQNELEAQQLKRSEKTEVEGRQIQTLELALLNFGVSLQETRHNMAGYFCLFSAVIIPSIGTYGQ